MALAACVGGPPSPSTPYELRYFMSFDCPACRQVNSLIEAIHHDSNEQYRIHALAFGIAAKQIEFERKKAGLSLPIATANSAEANALGVYATPTILLIYQGRVQERYQRVAGVKNLQQRLHSGALENENGILELAKQAEAFDNKEVTLRGRLQNSEQDYFRSSGFVLSNGVESVLLENLAPTTTAPRPGGGGGPRPIVLSDLLGKNLRVQGTVALRDSRPVIDVKYWEKLQ